MRQFSGCWYDTELDINIVYYKKDIFAHSKDMATIVTKFGNFRYILKTIYLCRILPLVRNGLGPCSPSGLVTGITFSFLFQIFSHIKTLLRVLVIDIPISGLLGLYQLNYPNLCLTTGSGSNRSN